MHFLTLLCASAILFINDFTRWHSLSLELHDLLRNIIKIGNQVSTGHAITKYALHRTKIHVLITRTMQSEYMCLGAEWEGCIWYSFGKEIEETIITDYRLSSKIYSFSGMILVVGIKWHLNAIAILNNGTVSISGMLFNLYILFMFIVKVEVYSWAKMTFYVFLLMNLEGKKQTFLS